MKKSCEHHYWYPMKTLKMCYKCGNKIVVYPAEYYSFEDFVKMYPLPPYPYPYPYSDDDKK